MIILSMVTLVLVSQSVIKFLVSRSLLKFTDNTATVAPALISKPIRGVNSTANGLITKVTFDVTDTTAQDVYLTGEIEYGK